MPENSAGDIAETAATATAISLYDAEDGIGTGASAWMALTAAIAALREAAEAAMEAAKETPFMVFASETASSEASEIEKIDGEAESVEGIIEALKAAVSALENITVALDWAGV